MHAHTQVTHTAVLSLTHPRVRCPLPQRLGNAICKLGKCVCGHWGPRERFATVSYREQIYVLGGVTHVQKQLCGQRSCGFQYRAVLNDVWRSPNGAIWTPMTLNVHRQP